MDTLKGKRQIKLLKKKMFELIDQILQIKNDIEKIKSKYNI